MEQTKPMEFQEGWDLIEKGITKLKRIMDGQSEQFRSEESMQFYSNIYFICTQKPHDYSAHMYDRYLHVLNDYIKSTVMPSLREKQDECMLRELVQRWSNHKVMVQWLSRWFSYLDRYYLPRRDLDPLKVVGFKRFEEEVYKKMNEKAKDALIALNSKEREGEQIDRTLMKNVIDMFVEIGNGELEDFEEYMVENAGEYYFRKASAWIVEYSRPEYMVKVEEALRKEKGRVGHYLHPSSQEKLLERVRKELLVVSGPTAA